MDDESVFYLVDSPIACYTSLDTQLCLMRIVLQCIFLLKLINFHPKETAVSEDAHPRLRQASI